MDEILLDQQFAFSILIGPWLTWGFAVLIFMAIAEALISQVHRPVQTVHIDDSEIL